MYRVVEKRRVTPHIHMFRVLAPAVARKAGPGQFVVVRVDEFGERIPITVAGVEPGEGLVAIYVAEVGASSRQLCSLEAGDELATFSGPLGNKAELGPFGRVLLVGGRAFLGGLHFLGEALVEAGNQVSSLLVAPREEELFLVEEFQGLGPVEVHLEDGGEEFNQVLDRLLAKGVDRVVTMGPTSMQRVVAERTRPLGVATTVNLLPIMVDGTGMCGACRVTVGGATRFACVDGPDFDGHQVDFEELVSRMRYYTAQEKIAAVLQERGVV